jgi:hypothetical protein
MSRSSKAGFLDVQDLTDPPSWEHHMPWNGDALVRDGM